MSVEPRRGKSNPQVQSSEPGTFPFNREKFLFRMLAGIFLWQALLFTYGVAACMSSGGLKACPSLGDRYENTVNVMVATTLALLGTTTVLNNQKNSKDEETVKPQTPGRKPPEPKA